VGTACLLAHLGVPLIDTTSFGAMATRGLPDAVGLATRDFMLDNARLIAATVDLPVQADLENGFGDSPKIVAQTIVEASATGVVGGSIEDATGRPADPIYPLEFAKERIHAAAEAARALPFPFMLTARADQYLWGRADLAEVIRRAQAFETAGANAIMVPGLSDLAALRSLCDSVSLPVVVLIGASPGGPARAGLATTGAKRIGVGGAMVRAALSAFVSTARDLIEGRELDGLRNAMSGREITEIFQRRLASS
jgi:2-methylisocitrate lyase-like PEP mutase family enzyme